MGLSAHNPARGSIMLKAQHSGSLMNPNPMQGLVCCFSFYLWRNLYVVKKKKKRFFLCVFCAIGCVASSDVTASPALDRRGLKLKRRGTGNVSLFWCFVVCKKLVFWWEAR
jgi:hypothetical protein